MPARTAELSAGRADGDGGIDSEIDGVPCELVAEASSAVSPGGAKRSSGGAGAAWLDLTWLAGAASSSQTAAGTCLLLM